MSEETTTTHSTVKNPDAPPRTREEILAWLAWMRERKAYHQQKADEEYAKRERRRKELEESGYFNFEWV